MKPEIVRLGSLYLNDFPVLPGTSYNNKRLAIGDTERGKELEWVQYNGNLYGVCCACLNISWDQLNDNGREHAPRKYPTNGMLYLTSLVRMIPFGTGQTGCFGARKPRNGRTEPHLSGRQGVSILHGIGRP